MNTVALIAFNFLLNSLWQIPLVFCAAWLAVRLTRRNGPQWEHRIWVIALFAALLLPLFQCNLQLVAAFFLSLLAPTASPTSSGVQVFTSAATTTPSVLLIPPVLLTLVLAAWAVATLYFSGRLLWTIHRTSTLRRNAHTLESSKYPILHNLLRVHPEPPQLLLSQSISGPAIIGILHPSLLLPPGFLDCTAPADIEAALAHEFAHLQRRDYAKNLFYEALTVPIAWHPVASLTRARIAESREILCDHLAAQSALGPHEYARALLRLASQQSIQMHQTIHAIGIFDTQSLERRIMKLTQSHIRNTVTRRLLTSVACGALAVATGAFALGVPVHADTGSAKSSHAAPHAANVSAGVMAGNRIEGENPKYPVEAKKKHIEGTVVLAARISKQGRIQSLHVIQGPELLRNSSLTAVRTWRYKPYLLNGKPVVVKTRINIIYSLDK